MFFKFCNIKNLEIISTKKEISKSVKFTLEKKKKKKNPKENPNVLVFKSQKNLSRKPLSVSQLPELKIKNKL